MSAVLFVKALVQEVVLQNTTCAICRSGFSKSVFGDIRRCVIGSEPVCDRCGTDLPASNYGGEEMVHAGRCCPNHKDDLARLIAKNIAAVERKKAAAAEANERYIAELHRHQAEERRQRWLRTQAASVDCIPASYRGKNPPVKLGKVIETNWHYGKDEALTQLMMLAIENECSQIQKVECEKDDDGGYPYRQSVWKYRGVI